jgi:REase_DpnII-MboI/Uncharacterized protein conserved in bacteria (DUF2321)
MVGSVRCAMFGVKQYTEHRTSHTEHRTPNISHMPDTMQVCLNGHVITDRLRGDPESSRFHCERCGALTLACCPTCGTELPGAGDVLGLLPIGACPAPRYCPKCGVAFPWVRKPSTGFEPVAALETFLRRVPLVIRQLRWRQGDKAPFRVEDERDLEDMLRSLLPLRFDGVLLESRTPAYSPGNRTDLLIAQEEIAVVAKWARKALEEPEIVRQCAEDVAYYRKRGSIRRLVVFVYDPEGSIRDCQKLENLGSDLADDLEFRCIVGGTKN